MTLKAFSKLGILLMFLSRVNSTNIARFTRFLNGIVENDLALQTYQTKRESVDRIWNNASPKMDRNDAKSTFSRFENLLIFLSFFRV